MQFILTKLGDSGRVHVEEEDILGVEKSDKAEYVAKLVLKHRTQYNRHDECVWKDRLTGKLSLYLIKRQVEEFVTQARADHEARSRWCEPCYDYGNSPSTKGPEGVHCLQCRLMDICRKAGGGDFRHKAYPEPQVRSSYFLMAMLFLFMLYCMWLTDIRIRLERENAYLRQTAHIVARAKPEKKKRVGR